MLVIYPQSEKGQKENSTSAEMWTLTCCGVGQMAVLSKSVKSKVLIVEIIRQFQGCPQLHY